MSGHADSVHHEPEAEVMHHETGAAVEHKADVEAGSHGDAHGGEHGEAADGHGDGHGGGEHGGDHAGGIPELENAIDYYLLYQANKDGGEHVSLHTIHATEVIGSGPYKSLNWLDIINISYAFVTILFLTLIALKVKSKLTKIPSGFQGLVELFVKWMDDFVKALLGDKMGRVFTPFIGTIFIYILFMNYLGLIPGMKAPVALNLNVPLAMSISVFLLVQYHGIRQNGVKNYVKHFAGEPAFLIPLNLPLHIIGEIAKPITLGLRLFGNITGEDVVIAALVGLTVGVAFVPIPLQALFYPLAMLFGAIQALVFATLSAVYILLMSAHEEHH